MCSVDSCTDLKIEKKLNLTGASCRKCDEKKAQIVLQGKFPYCRECFLLYFQHKYSGGIGKTKMLRTGDKVLLAFSGSFSSACLLNLIHTSLNDDRKKKTIFHVTLIFIDEGYNKSKDERCAVRKAVHDLVTNYGYKLVYTPLTTLGENVLLSEDYSSVKNDDHEKLKYLLSNISSKTAKDDIIERLRVNVLHDAAKTLSCNKIFTAETGDHTAIKIIGNIAIGRGKQLSADTSFITKFNDDILLIRPLRECSRKEIAFYNIFHKIHHKDYPWVIESDKFSSIQKLTESFIAELQQSFPSTVQTVASTGSKLTAGQSGEKLCIVCQCSLDIEKKELSAEEALRISQVVTQTGPKRFDPNDFTSINAIEQGIENISISNINEFPLCYACRIMVNESKMTPDVLNSIVKNGLHKMQQKVLHNEIKDFLL